MAYRIDATLCSGCSACEMACPNMAIREKSGIFAINPKKCTECIGHFDDPQCVAACPGKKTISVDDSLPRYQA